MPLTGCILLTWNMILITIIASLQSHTGQLLL